MNTYFAWMSIVLLIGAGACEEKTQLLTGTRESDEEKLRELREKIDSLSLMYPCGDASEWRFTAIGAKACGGPTGYVPYSIKLDTTAFLKMVGSYTALQDAYNREYGIASDCAYVMPPNQVVCEAGKPKLVWEDLSVR
ncbi:hypothetical protein [Parapedobacter sp. 10938]|uniref:hypothetical protein n=1 Tax=Parapedobacter flavus TaxID=3110225 RepID=UPI002DBD120D|nr:hypothetical protein [Parapedobacter sp. 10938]MEC3881597.1 hypothetical protein [Parapedobacter sp. 10938]